MQPYTEAWESYEAAQAATAAVRRGPLMPPRLEPARALTPAAPPRATLADLTFPVEVVQAHAEWLTRDARARGARHSLHLWREACEQALVHLARLATGTPEHVPASACFWSLRGDEYHLSITFTPRAPHLTH